MAHRRWGARRVLLVARQEARAVDNGTANDADANVTVGNDDHTANEEPTSNHLGNDHIGDRLGYDATLRVAGPLGVARGEVA